MRHARSSSADRVALPARPLRLATLAAQLHVPLLRDGYALVLNSAVTAMLGLVYWLVAARNYSAHAVGVNTAAISAMMFLAGLAQLNLMSALVRFVPILRTRRRRFIAACYLVAGLAAVACGAVFLVGIRVWAPALAVFGSSPAIVIWFITACVTWSIFNLQDSALTGLGAAVLVPVENGVYGIAKLVLLVALLSVSPRFGVFASWTAALVVCVLPVNALIFGPLSRRRAARGEPDVEVPTGSEIARFVAPDLLGALLWLAATTLMPVIVISIAGATSNAFFSLSWMIVMPLLAMSAGPGTVLVATAAADPGRLSEYVRQVLLQTARLVVPAAVAIAILAPYVLRLFGRQYAEHGAPTLALLALSAIPNAITALHISIYRVRRQMRTLVALMAALCGSVLLLAPLLLELIGIAGVGLAWLACQTAVAGFLMVADPTGVGATDSLRQLRARRAAARNSAALERCIPAGTQLDGVEPMVNDVAVGRAFREPGGARLVIKLASSDRASNSLRATAVRLRDLRVDPRLRDWEVALPQLQATGELDGRNYIVETELSGVSIAKLIGGGVAWQPLTRRALDAVAGLHRRTAELATVDAAMLDRWIGDPVRAIESILSGSRRRTTTLRRLESELAGQLDRRQLQIGWIHGDFVPGNVLIDTGTNEIAGIIDWEMAKPRDLPALDTTAFLLAVQQLVERRELGRCIADLLAGNGDGSLAMALAQAAPDDIAAVLDARQLALLAWIRHVASLLAKSERYDRHRWWNHYNVHGVLDRWGAP